MRKDKVVEINENENTVKKYKVYELTVKQILELFNSDILDGNKTLSDFEGQASKLLPYGTDATLDDLKEMAPSDIKLILDAFMEVNDSFFALARAAGLGNMLSELKAAILRDFSNLLVNSLSQAIQGP